MFQDKKTLPEGKDKHHGAITYIGSPIQFTFGDIGDDQRGAVIFYPDSNEFIHLKYPKAARFLEVKISEVVVPKFSSTPLGKEISQKYIQLVNDLPPLTVFSPSFLIFFSYFSLN